MQLLFCFTICGLLASSIQARVIIIDELGLETAIKAQTKFVRHVDQNIIDLDEELSLTEDNNNISSQTKGPGVVKPTPPAVRPEVSPGVLVNTFHLMYKKIGIFSDGIQDSRAIVIKNVFSGKCLSMKSDSDGSFTKGVETSCTGADKNYLVHLEHVGDGYVSLRLAQGYCIGAGFDPWSYAYVSKSDAWCKESHSHHWAIVQKGNHVIFKLRETGRCLTSWPKWEELFVDNNDCKQNDPYQEYQICDRTATNCWPPNAK